MLQDMFSVEQAGSVAADNAAESQGMLQNFIDYIKRKKVVVLEELAAEFGLRAQEVVKRVQNLENLGRISGVFDDRGKYIYITKEEMERVAEYITEQGRISVANLAAASNELILLKRDEGSVEEEGEGAAEEKERGA
jgi:hypothetical protein